jgi:hypothetical protein
MLSIYLSSYVRLSVYGSYSPCGPWPLFQFLNLYTVGRTSWDQPVSRPLPTHRTTQTQSKRTQTSMPRLEFEPMIPVFERMITVDALDRAASVIGMLLCIQINRNEYKLLQIHLFHVITISMLRTGFLVKEHRQLLFL